jgi:hypothetical protein
MVIHNTIANGNCGYHCYGRGMKTLNCETHHGQMQIRKRIALYISENYDAFFDNHLIEEENHEVRTFLNCF